MTTQRRVRHNGRVYVYNVKTKMVTTKFPGRRKRTFPVTNLLLLRLEEEGVDISYLLTGDLSWKKPLVDMQLPT